MPTELKQKPFHLFEKYEHVLAQTTVLSKQESRKLSINYITLTISYLIMNSNKLHQNFLDVVSNTLNIRLHESFLGFQHTTGLQICRKNYCGTQCEGGTI